MNPEDFSDMDAAFSGMAGVVWSMYQRFLAEGASMMEAAILSANFVAAMVHNAPKQESGESKDDN
jgi:hypothetical protein